MFHTYCTWSSTFITLTNIYKAIWDENNRDHKWKNIEKRVSFYFKHLKINKTKADFKTKVYPYSINTLYSTCYIAHFITNENNQNAKQDILESLAFIFV